MVSSKELWGPSSTTPMICRSAPATFSHWPTGFSALRYRRENVGLTITTGVAFRLSPSVNGRPERTRAPVVAK